MSQGNTCVGGLAASERCGFKVGKALSDPCYLMRRTVGLRGTDSTWYVRKANLPSVDKWFSRLDSCGNRVVNKKFCSTNTRAYVWECYAVKVWFNYWQSWTISTAPYVESWAIGADGLSFIEQTNDHEYIVCRKYKDFKTQDSYQTINSFEKNQFSSQERSRGPKGVMPPTLFASNQYIPVQDDEAIGIICAWDEMYVGGYWFSTASKDNTASLWFDLYFRPREINRTDLMMYMIKTKCQRQCAAENVVPFPCETPCWYKDDYTDTEKVKVPIKQGEFKEITGKEWNEKIWPEGKKKEELVSPDCPTCPDCPDPPTCPDPIVCPDPPPCPDPECPDPHGTPKEQIMSIVTDFQILLDNTNANAQGLNVLKDLTKSVKDVLDRTLRDKGEDQDDWVKATDYLYGLINGGIEEFRARKIAVLVSQLLARFHLIRSKKCVLPVEVAFWDNKYILDYFISVSKYYHDHAFFTCKSSQVPAQQSQNDAEQDSGVPESAPESAPESEPGNGEPTRRDSEPTDEEESMQCSQDVPRESGDHAPDAEQ